MECLDFRLQVENLFRSISDKLTVLLKDFYEPYGLTAPQAMILIALHHCGSGKISDMARNLGMTNSNLSVICRRLERDSFIIRKRDEFDQRVVYLHLTDTSKDLMKELDSHIAADYLCALECASEEDREVILKGLIKLNELLNCKK